MRQQALTHSTELLIERLRFAEARPFLGQLVGWKGLAISQKDFDDLQCIFKSWLAAAAKLWGRELSDRDFHSWMPCFQLSRSPPLRHLSLLERLLTRWCKEEMLENEHEALKLRQSEPPEDALHRKRAGAETASFAAWYTASMRVQPWGRRLEAPMLEPAGLDRDQKF